MSYKKHNWITYGRFRDIIEITIKDEVNGKKLDFFRCNNNQSYKKILSIIKEKYGFDYKPEIEKGEIIKEKEEKEVDWLNGDMDF